MNRVKDMVIVVAFLAAIMFAAGGFAFQTPSVEIDAADAAEPSEAPSVKQTPEPAPETVAESPAASAEATPTPEPVEEEPPYSETDAEMLAKVIWAEARGIPSDAEKAAVAWCALNRLDAGAWGETLSDVLTAPYQFAYRESSPSTFLNAGGPRRTARPTSGAPFRQIITFSTGTGQITTSGSSTRRPAAHGIGACQTPTRRAASEENEPTRMHDFLL